MNSGSYLQRIFAFWQLVAVKVRFNLRSEAAQSYLSYAWWLLEPLLFMCVFYIVFKIFLHRGTDDFVSFLLCGVVPWLWFQKSVTNSGGSITGGKGLISQVYLPKIFFPIVVIGQDFIKQSFVFALLLTYLAFQGYPPSFNWWWLAPIILTQIIFIMAVSFVFAFFIPFARDIKFLVDAGLRMMMFGSGVFYSYKDVLLPEHRKIFLLNPMANFIANYRRVLLENTAPMVNSLVVISVLSILVIALMYLVMRRFDNTLTRLALE
jgi:lipopolysaccharide transport system permease protein